MRKCNRHGPAGPCVAASWSLLLVLGYTIRWMGSAQVRSLLGSVAKNAHRRRIRSHSTSFDKDCEAQQNEPRWRVHLVSEDGGFMGGSDMRQIAALRSEVAGEGAIEEVLRLLFGNSLFQGGFNSYIIASAVGGNDPPLMLSPIASIVVPMRNLSAVKSSSGAVVSGAECAVGCSQLGRLAAGGFVVLRNDFLITSVLVRKMWRRRGIGTALVQELLHRLPQKGRDKAGQVYCAWAFTGSATDASFLKAAGGKQRGNILQVLFSDPLVAIALLISSFAPAQLIGGAQIFCFEALGDVPEYRPEGRLQPEQP